MRTLEIAVVVALLPYALHLLSPSQGAGLFFRVLPFLVLALTAYQVATDGYRWQMLPAYGIAAAFVVYECTRYFGVIDAPYLVGIAGIGLLLATIIVSTALPVFQLPSPTGQYSVGTQIRHIVEEGRRDQFSDRPDRARELMIQIWYPIGPSAPGKIAPYRDKRITRFSDAHFALVRTHSILDAPLADSQTRYPVVVYAPSWNGLRTESTYQAEELASHGYIVVAMDHPFSSRITVFPDGRIARRKFTGDEDYSSQEALDAFIRTADQQVEFRARDASFVFDTLVHLNASDPQNLLTGRLELDRVGIFGFSFGGATAAQACWLDRRFKAGLNLDGMVAGESAKQGTVAPFFFMFGDGVPKPATGQSNTDAAKRREIEFESEQEAQIKLSLSKYGDYWVVIPGLKHLDFSDVPFFFPLRFSGAPFLSSPRFNPAESERNARIVSRYVVAFFDERLKRIEGSLLEASPDFPGIVALAWKNGVDSQPSGR